VEGLPGGGAVSYPTVFEPSFDVGTGHVPELNAFDAAVASLLGAGTGDPKKKKRSS
jgi:hypothetical protein